MTRLAFLVAALAAMSSPLTAGDPADIVKTTDIPYAAVDGRTLRLDLYRMREGKGGEPLVVYVHGGAWRRGSKDGMPLEGLVRKGFAVASVEYRLSPVARFPAQAHDLKAAIRFLRANEEKYGYDADRIAIAGSSAGGHLAALVGVSNGDSALEGKVGDHAGVSSDVQAIVSYYGASNFETILDQSTPHGLGVRIPALQLLLGGQPDEATDLARLASPVAHVDGSDPPLLLLHGDQDPQMPINQSHELEGAYRNQGLDVDFVVVHGAAHGGKLFYDDERTALVAAFLTAKLR